MIIHILYITILKIIFFVDLTSTFIVYPSGTINCALGDTVKNEKVSCLCTQSLYQCTPVLNSIEQSNDNTLQNQQETETCQSKTAYVYDSITCICEKDGKWPHKDCYSIFGALPARTVIKNECEPNSFVIIDCNVCRCNAMGKLNEKECTKNVCDENKLAIVYKGTGKTENFRGKCEVNNWYSMSPCQFCYCLREDKLVCNSKMGKNDKNLVLGMKELHLCGDNFLGEAEGLLEDKLLRMGGSKNAKDANKVKLYPKSDCEVGTVSKKGCNTCFCLKNGKTLCTDKKCDK